jgi:putative NADH-flavin reductase
MAFQSVCLIGASGNLGKYILQHLLSSPQKFNVTVLARKSSSATYPENVKVVKVSDDYPAEELKSAFKGVDVVVASLAMAGMHEQYKIIDACYAAGVKRYFPTEFGLDDLPQWLLELREMFKIKHDVRDYLIANQEKMEWTSICCNAFFEMGVGSGFFLLNWQNKKAVLVDDGKPEWVACTLDTVGQAVVKSIEKPEASRNRILLVQDFRTSQKQILDAVEKKVGGWQSESVQSGPWLEEGIKAVQGGDNAQLGKLTFGTFAQGNKYEGRPEYGNDALGLKTKSFDEAMDVFWKEKDTWVKSG